MWVLVFVLVTGTAVEAVALGEFESMYDCFDARQFQMSKLDAVNEQPPVNTQMVCVRTE